MPSDDIPNNPAADDEGSVNRLTQIEHVVVLMLENRSLDNVLGWLHPPGSKVHIWPQGDLPNRFDGIPANAVNLRNGWPWSPTKGFASLGSRQRWRVPRWAPYEAINNVQVQMYANGDGLMYDKNWGSAITMGGFAFDYPVPGEFSASTSASASANGSANANAPIDMNGIGDVMGAYTDEELPVLYGLARNFAVSDRWFGSVPTETDPNRAFSLCGTSEGDEYVLQNRIFTKPTFFEGLNPSADGKRLGKTWALYYQDDGSDSIKPSNSACWTTGHFPRIVTHAVPNSRGRGRVAPYAEFVKAWETGVGIPEFSYIEPVWGWGVGGDDGNDFYGFQGNDYHAPAWVGPAEWDLNHLYTLLRKSPKWNRTLLIVVFDEHGGLYDHVAPPRAFNPDGIVSIGPTKFAFERMGPRVPALLITPFVESGTVFRQPSDSRAAFDHTSIIKTVLQWANADPGFITSMGTRVQVAPSFADVLSPTIVQTHAPMDFCPPTSFRDQCKKGLHFPFDAAGLTVDDHRAVIDQIRSVDEYLDAMRRLARMRQSVGRN
jgi:phospholipase C